MNGEKSVFLVDTGAEVSLISSSIPKLAVKDSQGFTSLSCFNYTPARCSSWGSRSTVGAEGCSNAVKISRSR